MKSELEDVKDEPAENDAPPEIEELGEKQELDEIEPERPELGEKQEQDEIDELPMLGEKQELDGEKVVEKMHDDEMDKMLVPQVSHACKNTLEKYLPP